MNQEINEQKINNKTTNNKNNNNIKNFKNFNFLKYFLLFFLIIILIIFVYYLIASQKQNNIYLKKQSLNKTSTTTSPNKQTQERKIQRQTDEIIKTNNIDKCDEIKDPMYRQACINNIAINLGKEKTDISYCQKVDDKLIPRQECEKEVIMSGSIKEDNINICYQTNDKNLKQECKDNFWLAKVKKTNNPVLCDNLSNSKSINFCYNSYIISKQKQQNKEFNCLELRGEKVQQDCLTLQKANISIMNFILLKQARPLQRLNLYSQICPKLQSNFFKKFCL